MISQVEKRGIVKTMLIILQKAPKTKNRHNARFCKYNFYKVILNFTTIDTRICPNLHQWEK